MKLPTPRLELHWREMTDEEKAEDTRNIHNTSCDYHLVLAATKWDIRYKNNGVYIPMGGTFSSKTLDDVMIDLPSIATPFRDGAHIESDAAELNLPAFVICGDHVLQLHEKAE